MHMPMGRGGGGGGDMKVVGAPRPAVIKDAVVDKFCVEECADFYQDEFLGCCTASMVQDEGRDKVLQLNKHIFQNLFSYSD